MAEPEPGNRDEIDDLFGDSDDEFQAEPQPQQQLQEGDEAAPAEFEEGAYDADQQPESAGEHRASADAGPQQPAQEEYQPEEEYPWEQEYRQDYPPDEAHEVGEDDEDELEAMFKPKKKRRQEQTPSEKRAFVEGFLARMEVAAQLDAESNRNRKPAINKLQMLADVQRELIKRDLQDEFLDGGVLGVLKLWLEPMEDGSLPNIKVRAGILAVLLKLEFFFEDRKEQLKKSQLGRIVMFLSKLQNETPANRRMALELVQRWSRPIFEAYRNDRVREEETADREADELRASLLQKRQQSVEEPATDKPKHPKDKGFRFSALVPEKAKLNYKRAPASAVGQDAAAGQRGGKAPATQSDRMMRKLDNISKQRKQSGKAAKVSVEGRGMAVG